MEIIQKDERGTKVQTIVLISPYSTRSSKSLTKILLEGLEAEY